ncbi:oligosaccharide flippase family protein [Nodosilinea nodulosa]|uniref:oligosaccharide flippase family protein n=1 Tax=Nodosilinea nodulosa TaxID=416001 RepID=UPI0002FCF538|nr:oligosaccharide flippase family protein [Nodosilinea nodulosa]
MPNSENLKSKVLTGGIYLTLRNILAALLSLVSVLVIARILGPKNYGIATVAIGIFYFLIWTCRLGLNTYLVRQPNLPESGPQQVISFYNSFGILLCALLWTCAPVIGHWSGQGEVTQALRVLIPAVWLDMVGMVSIAMLERDLRFAQVGLIEIFAQLGNYAVSIILVIFHWSYWGPILGTAVQYVLQLGLANYFYPIGWRWRWDWAFLKPALHYGITYSSSDWILHFRALRVPLLVSGLLGVEAAGLIGIANRFADQMSMLRFIVRRMSISVMSRLVEDASATRRAVSTGMAYQALLIGPLCALFACFGIWIIPLMFGETWLLSARIFPLIALGTLISALFDLHASVLYTVGNNRQVAIGNFWYVGVLWLSCLLLLPVAGLWGYGLSEILALPAFWVMHKSFKYFFGSPSYKDAALLVLAAIPPLVASIFYSPLVSTSIFVASYSLVFLLHPDLQKIPKGLLASLKRKAAA